MSKLKEIGLAKEEEPLTPQKRISPTSINNFFKCPRSYFYDYVAKIRVIPNIHLIKGSMVHETLEKFFKAYPKGDSVDLAQHALDIFETYWVKHQKEVRTLELKPEEVLTAKQDCLNMLNEYIITLKRQIKMLLDVGKAESERHAYYLLKPKFREIFVEDKELHCCGYIDRITKGFDGRITLADYKTSSNYGVGMTEEHERQLSIYSLLYNLQEKIMPDLVAVSFLRYGETYFLKVTPSLLRYARDTITDVWGKTRTIDIEAYPLKESSLCKWCQYHSICSGHDDWESIVRQQRLKDLVTSNRT